MGYKAYVRNGKSAIPVSGKRPVPGLMEWAQYCKRLPTEDEMDSWDNFCSQQTGIALMMGPISNLACVDIDCTDRDLVDQFRRMFTPGSRKVGRKGFTQFFRLTDGNSDPITLPITKFKKGENQLVEIFTDNRLIVIPPSSHPDGGVYEWENEPLMPDFDIECLPVLTMDEIEIVQSVMKMTTENDIRCNVSTKAMRYNDMIHLAGDLIRKRTPVEEAVQKLLEHDRTRNGRDRYFLDRSKGHRTSNDVINAYKYYGDMLSFVNAKKRPEEQELPQQYGQIVDHTKIMWGLPKEVEFKPHVFNLPIELIPIQWRAWILMASNATGVNPELIFYPAIAALSALIGNKVRIIPKKFDKAWELSANLWVLILALSGRKKSPALKIALHEIHNIQRELNQEKKDSQRDVETKKIKIQEVKTRLAEAIHKKLMPHDIEKIQLEYNEARADAKPQAKQLVVNVATPEAMIDILSNNPSGILCVEEEIGGLHLKFQKKGYELLRDLLIKSWDGNSSFTYSTKMHGDINISELCTGMIMAGQPSVFRRIADDIMSGKSGDDGFVQRAVIVFDDNRFHEVLDVEFHYKDYEDSYKIFRRAFDLPNNKQEIRLDPLAYSILMDFLRYIETKVTTENNDTLSSFWGKFRGNVVKVSFLLEFVKNNGVIFDLVSAESMRESIEIMKLNEVYISETFNHADYSARKYLNNMITLVKTGGIKDGDGIESVMRAIGLKDPNTVLILLNKLESLDWIRMIPDGKSTMKIIRNPSLYEFIRDEPLGKTN